MDGSGVFALSHHLPASLSSFLTQTFIWDPAVCTSWLVLCRQVKKAVRACREYTESLGGNNGEHVRVEPLASGELIRSRSRIVSCDICLREIQFCLPNKNRKTSLTENSGCQYFLAPNSNYAAHRKLLAAPAHLFSAIMHSGRSPLIQ